MNAEVKGICNNTRINQVNAEVRPAGEISSNKMKGANNLMSMDQIDEMLHEDNWKFRKEFPTYQSFKDFLNDLRKELPTNADN